MAQHFTIQPLVEDDIPVVAKMSAETFLTDRQTQLKKLGKGGYDMEAMSLESLPSTLKSPRCVSLKAVHDTTGDIMGYITWVFRGLDPSEIPRFTAQNKTLDSAEKPLWRDEKAKKEEKSNTKTNGSYDTVSPLSNASPENIDSINRLEAMEGQDFTDWMKEQMPEGTRCMFIGGFHVAPKYQRQGAGAALLKWGTEVADNVNVFAWVHSSEAAWKTYGKAGFDVIRELDVDLDQWAGAIPAPEGDGTIWGHYTIRYMKRLPNQ